MFRDKGVLKCPYDFELDETADEESNGGSNGWAVIFYTKPGIYSSYRELPRLLDTEVAYIDLRIPSARGKEGGMRGS